MTNNANTVKLHMWSPAVTCIKRSHFSWPVIEHFIWIEPLLKGHLSYKDTFSLSQRWSLYTSLTSLIYMDTGERFPPVNQRWPLYTSLTSLIYMDNGERFPPVNQRWPLYTSLTSLIYMDNGERFPPVNQMWYYCDALRLVYYPKSQEKSL